LITLLPMVVLIFWIGIYPNLFLSFMHPSVQHLLERVNSGGAPAVAVNVVTQILK